MQKMIRILSGSFLCLLLLLSPLPVKGDSISAAEVYVSIESYDHTIIRDMSTGFTFRAAIQKLAAEHEIDLTLTQNGTESAIYSVQGIPNGHFGERDGWYGYIIRNNILTQPLDFLEFALEDGDMLVLYYGDPEKTKILSEFTLDVKDQTASFTAAAEQSEWITQDGIWVEKKSRLTLQNVKIHLLMPGGGQKILNTNSRGTASCELAGPGVYRYYAESYVFDGCPEIVKTDYYHFLYGVKDPQKLTRAEAAAVLVHSLNIQSQDVQIEFHDVSDDTIYHSEIQTAAAAGLISGYQDGSFQPDRSITLLEFCTMLSSQYSESDEKTPIEGVPDWALEGIQKLQAEGLLEGLSLDWYQPVRDEQLIQLYLNII